MLQLSFVGTITGKYVDFTTAQHAALHMLAMRQDLALSAANAERIVGAMKSCP
jgi:2-haloacid dehalogenase